MDDNKSIECLYKHLSRAETIIREMLLRDKELFIFLHKKKELEFKFQPGIMLFEIEDKNVRFYLTSDPWRFSVYKRVSAMTYSSGRYNELVLMTGIFTTEGNELTQIRREAIRILKLLSNKKTVGSFLREK